MPEKISVFKITKFALKLFIKTQPRFFSLMIFLSIPHSFMHTCATLIFSHWFFDTVGDIITNGEPIEKAYIIDLF